MGRLISKVVDYYRKFFDKMLPETKISLVTFGGLLIALMILLPLHFSDQIYAGVVFGTLLAVAVEEVKRTSTQGQKERRE